MQFREMVAVGGKFSGLENQLPTSAGYVFCALRLPPLLLLPAHDTETGHEASGRVAHKPRICFCLQGFPSQGGPGRAGTVKIISGPSDLKGSLRWMGTGGT